MPSILVCDDEIEIGMGAHGEKGVKRQTLSTADDITNQMMAAILQQNKAFAVNTLGAGQQELANVFAGRTPARGEARFTHGAWRPGPSGQPLRLRAGFGRTVHRPRL